MLVDSAKALNMTVYPEHSHQMDARLGDGTIVGREMTGSKRGTRCTNKHGQERFRDLRFDERETLGRADQTWENT